MPAPTGTALRAMRELWTKTVEGVKLEATQPALFRALEQSVPVTQEEGQFAIGFGGSDAGIGSLLKTPQYQMQIEKVLRRVSGDATLRLRVIEGTTYADWEHTRRRDAATQTRLQNTAQKQAADVATAGSWDELYEQVSRLWANTEGRGLTLPRGRYFEAALKVIEEGMDRLYPKEGKADEAAERGLSRVIERVGSMTNSDPAILAYLLLQRRNK